MWLISHTIARVILLKVFLCYSSAYNYPLAFPIIKTKSRLSPFFYSAISDMHPSPPPFWFHLLNPIPCSFYSTLASCWCLHTADTDLLHGLCILFPPSSGYLQYLLLLFSFTSWLVFHPILKTFLDHLKFSNTTTIGGYRVQIMKALLQELGNILRRFRTIKKKREREI